MDSLINDFSNLSITNNNNFDDEINEFMNIDIDHSEKYKFPNAIIYGFKLNGDDENNFFYIGSSINPYKILISLFHKLFLDILDLYHNPLDLILLMGLHNNFYYFYVAFLFE